MIEVRHNGKEPRNDDGRTDPWEFIVHFHTATDRNGIVHNDECPGSRKNRVIAQMV